MGKRQELTERLKAKLTTARDIAAKAESEERDFTPEEREQVKAAINEAGELKVQLKQIADDDTLRAEIASLGDGIEMRTSQRAPATPLQPVKGMTLGEQFLADQSYQAWLKAVSPTGKINDKSRVQSPAVQFKSFFETKDLITGSSDVSAGAFVQTDYTGIYGPIGRYPLTLRQLISVRQTQSDTVEFVRQTKQVTEAAPTPEANVKEYTGATGEIEGKKPQGSMYFEKVTETVKTIAVWVGATKRALSDAAQLRGIIDQELRDDLADELESQLLTGDGVGENFTGLPNQTSTLLQAFNTDILTTCRQAITTLMVTGRAVPTAWLFHPADWETVELLQDGNNRFYGNGPFNQGPPRLWGVPVAQSFHVAEGSAWLADWRRAVLWDREQATLSVTDSHEDYFVRNIVAFLAEMRAAFGLIRPQAFINVALA